MAKSKRTATQLRLLLAALKRTYGKAVKDFPRCFFSGSAPGRCLLSSSGCPSRCRSVGSQRSLPTLPPSPERTPAELKTIESVENQSVEEEPAVAPAVQSVSLLTVEENQSVEEEPAVAPAVQSVSLLTVEEKESAEKEAAVAPAVQSTSLLTTPVASSALATIFNITASDIRQDPN
uniref:Uncharacterized protein n=1 Tax=Phytophthora ramorum TaxID=164328 RepID=H3H9J0_PHYRM